VHKGEQQPVPDVHNGEQQSVPDVHNGVPSAQCCSQCRTGPPVPLFLLKVDNPGRTEVCNILFPESEERRVYTG